MISKFWVKGCKFSAVVGTTLGLLMPGLPLLAVEAFSNPVGDSSFAPSEELLIAQSGYGCPNNSIRQDDYTSENYSIYVCEGADGFFFEVTNREADEVYTIHGVSYDGESGTYEGTIPSRNGQMRYIVGNGFITIFNNDETIASEVTN